MDYQAVGSLENYGYYASLGGVMNVHHNQRDSSSVFDVLCPDFVQDALYNSAKRQTELAVTCQPQTQTRILGDVRSWIDDVTTTPVCWLTGPAGTGKTTVAHTIAEEYDRRGQLAAAFFFWRKTGDRDDINKLVATLLCQVVKKIPSTKKAMEKALKGDSRVPSAALKIPLSKLSLEDQFSKLALTNLVSGDPKLIIIDGLDECASRQGICRLIEWVRKNKSPFRYFLTSRPEPEIKACFGADLGNGYSDIRSLCLRESEDDIRKYFVEQLEKVWPKKQRVDDGGPPHWPSESSLNKLVEKSEGLFLYAATAVRYIGGEGYPAKRLEEVIELHKGLDNLYAEVVEEAQKWDLFGVVMRSLMYLRYSVAIDDFSTVLLPLDEHLTSPGIRYALSGCHSTLVIPKANSQIEPYHASLRDFLIDQLRSGPLFLAPAPCHGQLMFGCISAITRAFSDGTPPPEYAQVSWFYHACSFLSTGGGSEELGELDGKAKEMIKKIDLRWVMSWLMTALYRAGVHYLRIELPSKEQLPDTYWTRHLLPKLKSVYVILENFLTFHFAEEEFHHVRLHHIATFVEHEKDFKMVIENFFRSRRFSLIPQIYALEGSVISVLRQL